jgi:hypothetical protein
MVLKVHYNFGHVFPVSFVTTFFLSSVAITTCGSLDLGKYTQPWSFVLLINFIELDTIFHIKHFVRV